MPPGCYQLRKVADDPSSAGQ